VKRIAAFLLLAAFGLAIPLSVSAQSDNNAARIASQKRNAKRSHKEAKARRKAMKKAHKQMGKTAKIRGHRQSAGGGIPPA